MTSQFELRGGRKEGRGKGGGEETPTLAMSAVHRFSCRRSCTEEERKRKKGTGVCWSHTLKQKSSQPQVEWSSMLPKKRGGEDQHPDANHT